MLKKFLNLTEIKFLDYQKYMLFMIGTMMMAITISQIGLNNEKSFIL